MPDFHSIPGARRVTPTSARVTAHFLQEMFPQFVSVPVHIAEERYIMDFHRSVQLAQDEYKDLNVAQLDTILSMMASVSDDVTSESIAEKLIEKGAFKGTNDQSAQDEAKEFVTRLRTDLRRRMSQAGLEGIMVKNAMMESDFKDNLTAFGELELSSIKSTCDAINTVYSRYMSGEKGDPLAEFTQTTVSTTPVLDAVEKMRMAMRNRSSSYTRIRKSHVYNHMFDAAFGNELCSMVESIPAKAGAINKVDFPEISFSDCIYMFHYGVSSLQGLTIEEGEKEVSIFSLANTLVTGVGDIVPFIPSEAGRANTTTCTDVFRRVFLFNVIERMLRDEPGDFYSRMSSSITANKFFQIDNLKSMLDTNLYTLSIAFESIKDTIAFFKAYSLRTDVYFSDFQRHNTHQRGKIADFFYNTIYGRISEVSFGITHPAYYRQALHFVNARTPDFLQSDPSFQVVYTRHQLDNLKSYLMADGASSFAIAGRDFINGSLTDFELTQLPYPIQIMGRRQMVEPLRIAKVPYVDPILSLDVVRSLRSIMTLEDFQKLVKKKNTAVFMEYILSTASLVIYSSVRELANAEQIPQEVAELVWDSSMSVADKKNKIKKTIDDFSSQVEVFNSGEAQRSLQIYERLINNSTNKVFVRLPQNDELILDVSATCDIYEVYPRTPISGSVLQPDGIAKYPYAVVESSSFVTPEFKVVNPANLPNPNGGGTGGGKPSPSPSTNGDTPSVDPPNPGQNSPSSDAPATEEEETN